MEMYEAQLRALGKQIEVEWFDAGHGSLDTEQNIEHQELNAALGLSRPGIDDMVHP